MKKALQLLAFDLGASNGRGILGSFDGERMEMRELHRFENHIITMNGVPYWDAPMLFREMREAMLSYKKEGLGDLNAFGIDTWGVDYGLLDKNGHLLGNPRSYRFGTEADAKATWRKVPHETLFKRTGIASEYFNTVYQLYKRKLEDDTALENAADMLLMPDLLGYFFTGEKKSEYTIATTTMLLNPQTGDWDWQSIKELGLPERIFGKIDRAGSKRGSLRADIAEELGLNRAAFAAVGSHDTASAVAAIPGEGSFAFCSSGTWSLFGVETDAPVLTDEVYHSNFSNEGTVQGGFRPLKNIMGLWLIQECRRDWMKNGEKLGWNEIVQLAEKESPFRSIIDTDCADFYAGGDMPAKIRAFCERTGQAAPENVGQTARCIYESLALKYRWALERLEEIKGARIDTLNIVGGGIQNRLLNRMAADATNRMVVTGPIEGAAIGNVLMQAVALGEIKDLAQAREVVRRSVEVEAYEPVHTQAYEDAYGRMLSLIGK